MDRSNLQLLQSAIDGLPVHHRETLLLCEVEEMSYQEIAGILSIPMGTVMSRLARARKAVRKSLRSKSRCTVSRDLDVKPTPFGTTPYRTARSMATDPAAAAMPDF
jgi:predicted DNA-binding protein (UPF0251 family)